MKITRIILLLLNNHGVISLSSLLFLLVLFTSIQSLLKPSSYSSSIRNMCNGQSYLTLLNNAVSQSLRDNCDVQLLVDQSHPGKPDVTDIESMQIHDHLYLQKNQAPKRRVRRLQ